MAKPITQIWRELWDGFNNNPDNTATFNAMADMLPPMAIYRGGKNVAQAKSLLDEGKTKDATIQGLLGALDVVGGVTPMVGGLSMLSKARPASVPLKQAGMFIGKNAKTWDKVSHAKALEMEKAGIDPRKVWSETGNWKAPDGMWRQEIPDDKARIRDYFMTPQDAYKNARQEAFINDSGYNMVDAMKPYATQSKTQLKDEYRRTGAEIVDSLKTSGRDKAKQLMDDRAGLDALLSAMAQRKYGPMSSYMAHGDLGAAYPDVYKMHTRIDDYLGDTKGQYLRGSPSQGEQIVLGKTPMFSGDKSTILHELQHAIQQREGWARGGSAEQMQKEFESAKSLNDHFSMANAIATSAEKDFGGNLDKALEWFIEMGFGADKSHIDTIMTNGQKRVANLADKYAQKAKDLGVNNQYASGYDLYKRLAGEAEARATQARMNMDMPQRLQTYPADSYDVPLDQLIVRYDNGPAMSAGRPVNHLGQEIPPTQYELAHAEAQRVAALPIEEGGLGLPVNNTAMDRARAMGFDGEDVYHATTKTFDEFRPSTSGMFGHGVYFADNPRYAEEYLRGGPPSIIPAKIRGNLVEPKKYHEAINVFHEAKKQGDVFESIKNSGIDGVDYKNNELVVYDPKNIRSRFAAFNPANRDSADLLAGHLLPLLGTGALGYGLLGSEESYAR